MDKRIDILGHRVEGDGYFLGSALADYAHGEGLDEIGLARRLGCPKETLSALRLCRRPHPMPAEFREDINRISTRFGADADILAEAVRRSNALAAMRDGGMDAGLLMAARDRLPAELESKDEDRES